MKHRFLILDGARGVAALVVLLYHLKDLFPFGGLLSGSFLAVDLFFLMSGFVIGYSYETKLISGEMSLRRFVGVRLLRLYPLYVAACAIGLSYFVAKIVLGLVDAPSAGELALASGFATVLLPNPQSAIWGFGNYPFAPSAWSLALEIWLNVAYAALVLHLSSKRVVVLLAISLALLVQQALQFGTTDLGWGISTTIGGVARFGFSFSLGLLIWRHRLAVRSLPLPVCAALSLLALCCVMIPREAVWLQLLWIVLIFPAFVCFTAAANPGPVVAGICDHLGRLSYGIYILHAPIVLLVIGTAKALAPEALAGNPAMLGVTIAAIVLAGAALLTYGFDEPYRRWVRRPVKTAVSAA